MSQMFNKAVMTDAGLELLNKAHLGTAKISFTNMRIGSGSYTDDEKTTAALQARTALKSYKNQYAFNEAEASGDEEMRLQASLSNCDSSGEGLVDEGYYITEIAIYAKDSTAEDANEVMYAITVSADEEHADYMPEYTGDNQIEITQAWFIKVDNAENVTVNVTEQYASREDMINAQADIAELIANLSAEITRATSAEEALESNLNAEITQAVSAEEARAKEAENALDVRLSLVELILLTDVAGNPFTVTFDALDGITVQGVWNTEAKRIEF